MTAKQYAAGPDSVLDMVITVNDHPVEVFIYGMNAHDSFVFEKGFGADATCWVAYNPCGESCTAVDERHNPVILKHPGRYRLVPIRGMDLSCIKVALAELTMQGCGCKP